MMRPPSPRGSGTAGRGPGLTGEPDDRAVGQILRAGVKSTLARWVLRRRKDRGAVPVPTPQDEATHAWDGQPRFVEDYTFVGAQAGLGVVLRLEWLPGRQSQRVWVVILRPDGVWTPQGGLRLVRIGGGSRWAAGGLTLDCQAPFQRWSVRYCGPLIGQGRRPSARRLRLVSDDEDTVRGSVDLTFVSEAPPYVPGIDDDPELVARRLGEATWDARLWRATRDVGLRGYVQLGQLLGTVAVGDVLVPVRAMSLRQHHWGLRDWEACEEAYRCAWMTEDERRGWLHHTRRPLLTRDGGFVAHRGRVAPVRSLSSTAEIRPGRAPARIGLTFGDVDGTRRLQTELVSEFGLVVDRARIDLGLLRITGRAPGWGIWAGLRPDRPER